MNTHCNLTTFGERFKKTSNSNSTARAELDTLCINKINKKFNKKSITN